MARAETIVEQPEGVVFGADFVSEEEERELLARIGELAFGPITMRGQTARRTVRHFGYDYDYESYGKLVRGEPIPDWLLWLRDRGAGLAELEPGELVQALVSRYPPGARMRFQRSVDGARRVYELELPPRSAYVLAGKARSAWQHSIPPVKELRYSITFRTLESERWVA